MAACAVLSACLAAWQENVRPKMYVQLGKFQLLFYYCIILILPARFIIICI